MIRVHYMSRSNNDDSHEYGGNGKRMRSKLNGVANWPNYVWDEVAGTLLAEYTLLSGAYTLKSENSWGLGLISTNRESTKRYFHFDGMGNTIALTDGSENVTDTYGYTLSGTSVTAEDSGTSVNPFRWMGRNGAYSDGAMGSDSGFIYEHEYWTPALTLRLTIARISTRIMLSSGEEKQCNECKSDGDFTYCGHFCLAWREINRYGGSVGERYLAECEACCSQIHKKRANLILTCIGKHCQDPNNPPCKCAKNNPCTSPSQQRLLLIIILMVTLILGCRKEAGETGNSYLYKYRDSTFWRDLREDELLRIKLGESVDDRSKWLVETMCRTDWTPIQGQAAYLLSEYVKADRSTIGFAEEWMKYIIRREASLAIRDIRIEQLRKMTAAPNN